MIRRLTALAACSAFLSAQELSLHLRDPGASQRFSISSTVSSKGEREVRMDGAVQPEGEGDVWGTERSTAAEIVFVRQGPWRRYEKLECVTKGILRSGPAKRDITGELTGRSVRLVRGEDGGLILLEGDGEDLRQLGGRAARGIHPFDLSVLLPGKAVAPGAEYEGRAEVRHLALALFHEVTPRAGSRGGSGNGVRGRQRDRLRRRGVNAMAPLLESPALQWTVVGTATPKDELVHVEVKATAKGKGTPEDLGLSADVSSDARVAMDIRVSLEFTAVFDPAAGRFVVVELAGKSTDARVIERTLQREDGPASLRVTQSTLGLGMARLSLAPVSSGK
eukprot:jgi/Undpi1/11767/HiC_scaffold_37.g14062.m1